jgi:hypothetical protein
MKLFVFLSLIGLDPRYHTFEETITEIERIRLLNPSIVHTETLGYTSVLNRPIIGVKISDNPFSYEPEPTLLFVGVHHAEEVLGLEVSLFTMERIVSNYGVDSSITKIVNETQLWFIPLLNADGHHIVTEGIDITWRKNLRDNNLNGQFDPDFDGVDLNRNYSFNWDSGGSSDPSSEYYRGPAPFSENETRVIRDLSQRERFLMAIDFHSARTGQGEIIYYPWRWGANFCVDYPFIRSIAQLLARSIVNDAGTGTYASIYGTATEGNFRNYLYAYHGTYAYTLEISWGCLPPGERVDSICERVYTGLIEFIKRVFQSGIAIQVLDNNLKPLEAEIRINGYYDPQLPPRTSNPTNGMFWKLLTTGIYNITIVKDGYDTLTISGVEIGDTLIHYTAILNRARVSESKYQKTIIAYRKGRKLELNLEGIDCTHLKEIILLDSSGRLIDAVKINHGGKRAIFEEPRKLKPGVYFIILRLDKNTLVSSTLLLD